MTLPTSVVETHISSLFFVGDRVYKRKKPVRNGFLDFTTVESRRIACRREVELNRRLAPDIYLGVAELTLDGIDSGLGTDAAPPGETLDHLVVMCRLPENRRLSARLDGLTIASDLRDVARLMATFHVGALRSPAIDDASGYAALSGLWEQGLEQIAPFAPSVLDEDELDRIAQLSRDYLSGRHDLFDQRIRDGRACDGHGDLQAEDIFILDDGPRILDCLEFSDLLRCGDVLADVAFLAMDLERLGQPELGWSFLDDYQTLSSDHWPTSLAHHYMAYRAHIRSKVACLRHEQGDADAAHAARGLHDQCLDHLGAARIQLIVVGGSPGTGKTSVSRALSDRLDAVLLSTDTIRDGILPRPDSVAVSDDLDRGRYTPDRIDAVYTELLRLASVVLSHGQSVVLDASWLDPRQRQLARAVGEQTTSVLTEFRCVCPDDLAGQRIRDRIANGRSASEATPMVADRLSARAQPWPEAVILDTDRPLAVTVTEALRVSGEGVDARHAHQ